MAETSSTTHTPDLAPCIMVVGTGSSVGKSLVVAGLCRWFQQRGFKPAPFKAQNMALNSYVTPDGKEIGTAQAMQAAAAKMTPTVAINPILLKPEGHRRSQVVVQGEAIGSMSATDYHAYKPELRQVVAEALTTLRRSHDVVIIEGAGSPVEMNLKSHDIVNMFVAQLADARVVIVGDIDKGGIFASLIGTYNLLTASEQQLVAGFIINKFRGDPALLGDGLGFIEAQTGAPVLGVLPMLEDLTLPDEDGHLLRERMADGPSTGPALRIGIVKFPRMSNFDEFALLRRTPGIDVQLVESPAEVLDVHLLILPGSKQTAADLAWLRAEGFAPAILRRYNAGLPILAICGGFQMLGEELVDKLGMESSEPHVAGLGLLPITTHFAATKTLRQVRWQTSTHSPARSHPSPARSHPSADGLLAGLAGTYAGYEIHCGQVYPSQSPQPDQPLFVDRAVQDDVPHDPRCILALQAGPEQNLFGTLVHGVLNHAEVIANLAANLRARYFMPAPESAEEASHGFEASFDRLAAALDRHLDVGAIVPLHPIQNPSKETSP